MKLFVLTLLLSVNSYAQYRVEVKNGSGKLTHQGDFETSLEAEKWIMKQSEMGAWGNSFSTVISNVSSEKTAEELKKNKKKAAIEKVKAFDKSKIKDLADVKDLLEDLVEAIK